MYYWKTFLTMCVMSFVLTLGILVCMILGVSGVIKISTLFWILCGIFEAVMAMSSFICGSILFLEIKERREKHVHRTSIE